MPALELAPVSIRAARRWINTHHRHHRAPQGAKFAIAAELDGHLVGVVLVGRPVSRHLDDGRTAEVTRLATDGTPNACSLLYGAAWRAARAMGYRRIITYTLESEPGTSLRAAGWRLTGHTDGRGWDHGRRHRSDTHPLGPKARWLQGADLELAP